MKKIFLSILFASLFASSTVFSVPPKGDPKKTGRAIIEDIPEDETPLNSMGDDSQNTTTSTTTTETGPERNSRKRNNQERNEPSNQDQNDQSDQQDPPKKARNEEILFVEERMEEEVESDHEGEDERDDGSFVSDQESNIKIIKDRIITFLSSSHPKLKEKYEWNPEGYDFSAEKTIRFEVGQLPKTDLSKLSSSEKATPIIIVYDDGNVEFLRLKNLAEKELPQSGGCVLIAPQFYDIAAYERLNNLDDNEDSDERKFEEDLLLIGIDLHGSSASEEKRNLRGLYLKSAILIGANLSNTDLTGSFLQKTDFSCADLQRVVLKRCTDLSYAILSDTDLSFSFLEEVALVNIQMRNNTNFYKAILSNLVFNSISRINIFSDINFKKAKMLEVIFYNCGLKYVNMEWLEAEKLSFNSAPLYCVDFSNSTLTALSILNIKNIGSELNFTNATIIESCILGKIVTNYDLMIEDMTKIYLKFYLKVDVNEYIDRSEEPNELDFATLLRACTFPISNIIYNFYCDHHEQFSLRNINSSILNSDFTGARMSKVFISGLYFKNCTGIEQLSDAFHSIFKNVHFKPNNKEIQKSLKEKGAKVNYKIDMAYSGAVWKNSDDPDLAKVLANALFSEVGRTIVVGGAGVAVGSFTPAGPLGGLASALRVDSALRGGNNQ